MDLMELLSTLRSQGDYDNNLPSGGPARAPREINATTKGDVKAAEAVRDLARREAEVRAQLETEQQPQDSLASQYPALTGPARAVGNALTVAPAAALDAGQAALHGALGLEEADPWGRAGRAVTRMKGALGDTVAPARALVKSGVEGLDAARQALREKLIAGGARSKPRPESEYGAGMDAELRAGAPRPEQAPAMAAAREALPQASGDLQRVADDGSSSGDTIDYLDKGKRITLPTMLNGKRLSDVQAIKLYQAGQLRPVNAESAQGALGGGLEEAPAPTSRNARGALEGATAAGPVLMPGTSRESLNEMFSKKVAEIEKANGRALTEDQKKELQLDFFLRLMASGSRRGSNLIGNAGESGLATSALAREMRSANVADQKSKVENAFREVSLADKDHDNAARDRQLNIFAEQIAQGKYDVKTGGRGGNYILIDKKTGAVKDTGIKAGEATGNEPAEVKLLKHLRENPQDLELLFKISAGKKDKNDNDQIFDAAMKLRASDMTGRMTPEEAVQAATETMRVVRGGAPAGKPDPAANKGRTITGPDGRFKSDGKQWVKVP